MADYDPFNGKRPKGRYFGGNRSTAVKVSKKRGKATPTVGRYFGKSPNQTVGSPRQKKSAPPAGIPAVNGYLSQERARAQARDMRQAALERAQRDNGGGLGGDDVPMPNFMDLLQKALGFVKSQQSGVNYGALRSDLSNRASEGDSKIAEMYRQLQAAYQAEGPGIQKTFADSGQKMSESVDEGISNTTSGFEAARDAQSQQLAGLGIEEAATSGGMDEAAREQALAKSRLEELRAINAGQNQTNAQTAGTFNTELGQAAGLGSSFRRGQLASQLQQKLAELSVQEQRDKADLSQNALAMAMGLAQNQQEGARYEREWQDRQSDQQYDRDADAQKSALEMLIAQQQNQTASRFNPQDVLKAVEGYTDKTGTKLTTDEWIRMMEMQRKLLSQR